MSEQNQQSQPKPRTPRDQSKTAKAKAIYTEMEGQPRKDVLQKFENELLLTPKGASTYYQTLRKANGLVTPRPTTPKSAH